MTWYAAGAGEQAGSRPVSASPVLLPLSRLRALPAAGVDGALAVVALVAGLWPFFSRVNPTGAPWHWWGYRVRVTFPVGATA